jgi:hypothetical protein
VFSCIQPVSKQKQSLCWAGPLVTDFPSLYSSPRLTRADSYSRVAASDAALGAVEVMDLKMASALEGSVLASFWASWTLSESPAAMLSIRYSLVVGGSRGDDANSVDGERNSS